MALNFQNFLKYFIPSTLARIFLQLPNGQIVAQLRDNIPNISNPGQLSTFGGSLEDGETPLQAARRELEEETCLSATDCQLEFITMFKQQKDDGLKQNYLFLAKIPNLEKIEIQEGVGLVILRKDVDFELVNAGLGTKIAWKFLQEYLQNKV